MTFNNSPNYEDPAGSRSDSNQDTSGNVYAFTVVATDIESRTPRREASVDVVVTVADVEEDGVITVDNLNPGVGDTITFTLTDPDGGIVFAPTDASPPGFNWVAQTRISNGAWVDEYEVNNLEDFTFYYPDEDDTGRELRVVIDGYSDRRGSGKTVQSEATAPVTADPIVNAPPRFRSGAAQDIPETGAGEDVGEPITASDRENDSLTFGIDGDGAADFVEIDPASGQLRTTQALDFETSPPVRLLTVTVHDGKDADGNLEATPVVDARYSVSVHVVDVEEDGVVSLTADEPAVGATVQATLEDGDIPITGESWRWARSTDGRGGWLNIPGATSNSYTVTQSDADFHLRARVTYTDNRGAGKSAEAITRKVFGENQRPTFPSTEDGARTVAENSRSGVNIGAPVAAEDPESHRLTYSLSGADASAFTITASGGQLRTKEPLDFEGQASYSVTVEVHDGRDGLGNPSTATDDSQNVTITLENVEEPGSVTLSTLTGTVQARVDVTATLSDDDIATNIRWRWTRSPNGRSGWVNIGTGAVYVPTLTDAGNYIRATATYTDPHGPNQTAKAVSARVADPPPVNSAPVFPSAEDGRRSVAENASSGAAVGVPIEAEDVNAGDTNVNDPLAYSLSGSDADSFTIKPATGQLELAPGVTLDYEGKRTYRVTVSVTDGRDQNGDDDSEAIDDTINVVITVTDVNEGPEISSAADLAPSHAENSSRAVATYSATDPGARRDHLVGERYRRVLDLESRRAVLPHAAQLRGSRGATSSPSRPATAGRRRRRRHRHRRPPQRDRHPDGRGGSGEHHRHAAAGLARHPVRGHIARRRRWHHRPRLAVGALLQPLQLGRHRGRDVEQVHGGRRRRQPLPAGHGDLRGPPRQQQVRRRQLGRADRSGCQTRNEHATRVRGGVAGLGHRSGHGGRPPHRPAGARGRPGRG